MKKLMIPLLTFLLLISGRLSVQAQVEETAQLVLNIEKLTQFKAILSDMKKGYDILNGGYNTVKNISEGNFNIHKQFLDGLMDASPMVKNYRKVPEIINYQLLLVKECKASYSRFSSSGQFNAKDLNYISQVYSRLFNRSLRGLDELLLVVTSGKLRMSDDERLQAIDRIHAEMEDSLQFLRRFSNETTTLSIQRERESHSIQTSRNYLNK